LRKAKFPYAKYFWLGKKPHDSKHIQLCFCGRVTQEAGEEEKTGDVMRKCKRSLVYKQPSPAQQG